MTSTEQQAAAACRCDRPVPMYDAEDDETRCLACGRLFRDRPQVTAQSRVSPPKAGTVADVT